MIIQIEKNFIFHGLCNDISAFVRVTLMLPIFFKLFSIHLKLELLAQFPAPKDEK